MSTIYNITTYNFMSNTKMFVFIMVSKDSKGYPLLFLKDAQNKNNNSKLRTHFDSN